MAAWLRYAGWLRLTLEGSAEAHLKPWGGLLARNAGHRRYHACGSAEENEDYGSGEAHLYTLPWL